MLLLIAGVAETLAQLVDARWRAPVWAGGAAGVALGLAGLPFVARLRSVTAGAEAVFWKWWAGGLLLRLALLLTLAFGLGLCFREHLAPALLTMAAVYLVGMFAEAIWLAKCLYGSQQAVR